MELAELSGGTESSQCVGEGSSDYYWGLRPQGIVVWNADPPGSNPSSAVSP